ncbi:carbohydrate ABC transporter permease [Cellulomonas denverensis]|uniref:Sugar ABC transporter permease n=1 Tax=Cellulomonas denverensis TaxID=264297 RepID=A0A7X6KUR7_9CELL|nr:sugar ABC transporter permease [Cellulomonas denverensis]NKY22671.1 sugar ABC transporter permease [Cellulomonas denverensis]GIG24681.1 sugar ABC transporter permease [Cellulomonas denverensis]
MSVSTAPPAPPRAPRRKRRETRDRGVSWSALALLIPAVVVLGVFVGYPLVRMLTFSFQDFSRQNNLFSGKAPNWVGIDQYRKVLTDGEFWALMGRSFALMIVLVTLTMTLGMLIALLMNRLGKWMKLLVSVGLLLAWAMPALTSTVIFQWMFDTSYGVVNYVLTQIGLDFDRYAWLSQPLTFFMVVVFLVTWQSVPFVAFTLFAALTQVPGEVLEAAELDGAGRVQRFRQVIVPFIRPVIAVVLMLQVIWDLRVFTQVYALRQSSAAANTDVIGTYIYRYGVAQGNYSEASAIAVIFALIMLGLAFFYIRSLLRNEDV